MNARNAYAKSINIILLVGYYVFGSSVSESVNSLLKIRDCGR